MNVLSDSDRTRYNRQMLLREWGEAGQQKLRAARVFIAGAGGLGSPVAIYLAGIWLLHDVPRPLSRLRMSLTPIGVVLVLLTPLTPQPILLTGVVVGLLLAAKLWTAPRAAEEG